MKYNIYKNLSNEDFKFLKTYLNKIELISSPFMQQHDFYLNRSSYNDVLALDYLQKRDSFYGNIGLGYFEDVITNSEHQFELYILKALDKDDERFYKKVVLPEKYSLDIVYEKVYSFFGDCLSLYESIKEEDLNEKITLRK